MDTNIFERFNSTIDTEGLKHDVEAAAANDGEFAEVPKGTYEVSVSKLELGETGERSKTPGMPMAKVWFTILAGPYKNQRIFMNQMLTTGFGIHRMNQFLESLESGMTVVFENFVQYAELMENIFKAVEGKGEYELSYTENSKGFSEYKINQRFTN